MSYPLNNTNYNWERRPKKCKGGSGGGGDSEPFDAKKFGDDLMKYIYNDLPSSTVFPDMYCVVEMPDTFLGPPESDVEFAAILSGAIQDTQIVPLYSSIPDNDKTIIAYAAGIIEPKAAGTYQTSQVEVDGTTYYVFFSQLG